MNLQAPRAFSRREKVNVPEPSFNSLESHGSKPVEVHVERIAAIPSLSSFGESTSVASSEFSIQSSYSEDTYESMGVISRLEDFIVREIGHVMDDPIFGDEEFSYTGGWARAAFSQDFSVLPSKKSIVKSTEWKQKRLGTVNDILECSLDKSSSLLTNDSVPSIIGRKRGAGKDIDVKNAGISLKKLPTQSEGVDGVSKGEKNRLRPKDSLKKAGTKKVPSSNLVRKSSTMSLDENGRGLEFDNVRKSQSNVSHQIRNKCGILGSLTQAQNITFFHQHAQDVQTEIYGMQLSKIRTGTHKYDCVDHSFREQGREPLTRNIIPQGTEFVSKILRSNSMKAIEPQLSFRDTIIEYQIGKNYPEGDCADKRNSEEGKITSQHSRNEEAREPNGTQRQAHAKKSISNRKLVAFKFPSIKSRLETRKKGRPAATKEHMSINGKESQFTEEMNSKSEQESVTSNRIKDQKQKIIKVWKRKLFHGPDRVKWRAELSSSAFEVYSSSCRENGDDGHLPFLYKQNSTGLVKQISPDFVLENQTSHSESSSGCLPDGNHFQSKGDADEKTLAVYDDISKEREHMESPLLADGTSLEINPVSSGKSRNPRNLEKFDEIMSLEVGQEVVGEFGSRFPSPKRNLGDFLRHPFRKLQEASHTESTTSLRGDTLVEPCPTPCLMKELDSEGKCQMDIISSNNSMATESTKSLDDKSASASGPGRHQQQGDMSMAVKLEIRRLIKDMAVLRNSKSTKPISKPQPTKGKSMKMLAALDGIVKERLREDNKTTSQQPKSFSLFGATDDFTKIFSCPCQAQ